MNKRIIATVTVLALVSLSAFAFAAAPRGARGRAADPVLTADQQTAVAKIVDKHHAKLVELREQIWAKHTELQALSRAGKAEKSDIQSLVGDISKLRTAMNAERDAMRAEIEKETGIKSFGRGYHRGGGMGGGMGDGCPGVNSGNCPGTGPGAGTGFGPRGGMMGGGY